MLLDVYMLLVYSYNNNHVTVFSFMLSYGIGNTNIEWTDQQQKYWTTAGTDAC